MADATSIHSSQTEQARWSARKFFSRHGILSRWHPNYEYRQGQLEMAEAIESAIADKRHLLVDAGTGTGKTLAYLIPAILSGRRVVISTGTKNLQEQLFFKDIPFLQQHFDHELKVCYMKGRSNYACRQKIYEADREAFLTGLEEVVDFQSIREWEKITVTGDRVEIAKLPENSSAWLKIDARRDLCTGQKCNQFDRCFITDMHRKAAESDIIIVNHHLFFADMAVKDREFEGVIPEYAVAVLDEAHELEDVAGQYFGVTISTYQIQELARDVSAVAVRKKFGSAELDRTIETLVDRSERFFILFGGADGRIGFREHTGFLEKHEGKYDEFRRSLELLSVHLQSLKDGPEELIPLVRRAEELRQRLEFWMRGNDRSYVYWVERRGRGTFLQATPIDVSPLLEQKLFDKLDSVILTSATLAVQDNFDFAQRRLGIRHARALVVPSHFDFEKQSLLYVPQHMPDPRTPAFTSAAADEITKVLQHSQGRAFVLFTSYQQMRQVYDRVSLDIDYPTLLQGTGPRSALLEEFRRTPNAVLFATSSFWQGVDVQGDQLSCVIIDKLPFSVPSDPVVEARMQNIRDEGGNPFYDYQVPQAALTLKQGFGRLIRSRSDRGVLVLLDNRITKQRYGQIFFDSLPCYRFTTQIDEVEQFFNV